MTEWRNKIDVSDLWKKHSDGNISPTEIAGELGRRLKNLKLDKSTPWHDREISILAKRFEVYAKNEDNDEEEFDLILSDLYDVADDGKMLWVKTV